MFQFVICILFILSYFAYSSHQSEFEHPYRGGTIIEDEDFKLLNTFSWEDVHEDIPASFDARTAFPHCPSIAIIHDQGDCGSCWAVSGTDMINDRFCVISKGAAQVQLSAYDALNCCVKCLTTKDDICAGGDRSELFDYFHATGLVTGGAYQSNLGCIPYPIPPKDVANYTTHPPECRKQCSNQNYQTPYEKDIHVGDGSFYYLKKQKDVQMDIMKRGPVSAIMDVYKDFIEYKKGVYIHKSTQKKLFGHTVRIIGWGTEDGIPYWLGANSWNTWWGMDGFFKIRRGTNEVKIESRIAGILPKLMYQ